MTYCAVCSTQVTRETVTVPALEHTSGEIIIENEKPASCTAEGSYDEVTYCVVCSTEVTRETVTIPALEHTWAEDYQADKAGHWHSCGVCGAASPVQQHVSGGAATSSSAEVCTVCGYEISPKKSDGGNTGDNTGGNTSDNTGGSTGDNTGGSTGDNTGGSTGGNTGGSTGNNTGGTTGGSTSGSSRPVKSDSGNSSLPAVGGKSAGWDDIVDMLLGLAPGSRVVIALNGNTDVPGQVFRAAAQNRLVLEFTLDSVKSWIVDGAGLGAATGADLSILPGNADRSALRGVPGANMKISGTNIPADLKLSFRKEFAGQFANVYKMIDGRLEFQGCARLGEDGAAVVSGAYAAGGYVVMVCGFSDLSGDMNNDGVLNALDAAEVLKTVVGISEGANPLMGDYNGDGAVNALDAAAVLKMVIAS